MESENLQLSKVKTLLKSNLYSIEPVDQQVDRNLLSLAYTPGVGTVCTDIHNDPAMAQKFTIRERAVALVSDGSLLDCPENNFMPVMDWFVFQVKQFSGLDAFPFVVMKNTDLSLLFKNLGNTYAAVVYLDGTKEFKYPDNCLVVDHRQISKLSKRELTDATFTANALTELLKQGKKGQLASIDYEKAMVAPQVLADRKITKFIIDPQASTDDNARKFHEHYQGKIYIKLADIKLEEAKEVFTEKNLRELIKEVHPSKTKQLAVIVTDGTAILGLGNIGPLAGLPVMEGKSLLFRILGEVEVVPFCISPLSSQEEIELIASAAGNFMGINLEDIKAPECFEVEEGLKAKKLLPVFHDDQHGTAIVTLAALINALKLAQKSISEIKIIVNGAGAAGVTIAKLLLSYGAKNVIVCDSKGAIYKDRKEGMNPTKHELASLTNHEQQKGHLQEILKGTDVFIGVSMGGALKGEWVKTMNKPIIFAMANPVPEIYPEEAKNNGAFIYGSGRSDFQNQINNSLVFPGIFKGIKEHKVQVITDEIKTRVAVALARTVSEPKLDCILPSSLDKTVGKMIADEMGLHIPKL